MFPELPPTIFRRKMNQFKVLRVDEPNGPPRECSIQPPVDHFKSSTSYPKTSPVVSDIIGRPNHVTDNGDVEVLP